MKSEELYTFLSEKFNLFLKEKHLLEQSVEISAKTLTPLEAIGVTERKDYPILTGKEIMLQATYKTGHGQIFTNAPSVYHGTLSDIARMDIINDVHARNLFLASINAVMNYYHKAEQTIHCKNDGPKHCANQILETLKASYHHPKISIIGYQPSIIESLVSYFQIRVFDLNPENINQTRFGITIEDGHKNTFEAIDFADLILCTGSTICNGSIVDFLNIEKEVLFYGTSISGCANWLGIKRICFSTEN